MSTALRADVVAPESLTGEHVALWHRLLDQEFDVASPFLTPEFVRVVSRVRGDVAVAVLRQGRRPVGFFPFQWKTESLAGPVAGRMSDIQAAIVPGDLNWSPADLLGDCDLQCWDFDHLLASQPAWRDHHFAIEPSPYLDLSQGFDAYCEERKRTGSDKIRQILRKRRQLEREHGPLRFQPHVADERVFDTLLKWKSSQFVRSGLTDLFVEPWPRRLLAALFDERTDRLAAAMAVLYAGDRPVAIDLGMRSGPTLHSWFVAYDAEFSKYSPGHVLTMTIAEQCAALGISRIELGKGPEEYKRSIASGAFSVAEGSADLRPLPARVSRGWHRTRRWLKHSPLGPRVRTAARFARSLGRTLAPV